MISLMRLLNEIEDTPKAIILAGAPGAGKGYVLKGLDLRTKSTGNPYIDLQIKIFRGDASDNITPVVNKRFNQNKLLELIHNKEMLKEFFNNNDELKKIYDRNELLIDCNKIPNEIKYEIRNCIEFI